MSISHSSNIELSVVVITKNEEKWIKRCLDSILQGITCFNSWEIILVDSYSIDNTVEIAKNYPCKIYRIKSNYYTAALGRSVGTNKSSGKYILYLDGDMELYAGWLEIAKKYLDKDEKAAGIIGIRNDLIYNEKLEIVNEKSNIYKIKNKSIAKHFGGALLAKKNIIKAVGGYDPRMIANEEPELHSRIIKNGFHVLQLPIPMIIHHDEKSEVSLKNRIKEIFNKNYLGLTSGLKYSFSKKNVYQYFLRLKDFWIPTLMDLLSLLLLFLFIISNNISYIYFILMTQTLSLLFTIIIKKPKRFLQSKFLTINFYKGLFHKLEIDYIVEKIT